MICVLNENCAGAGRRAYHADEDESKRKCENGNHWRVGQSRKAARSFEKVSGNAARAAFYRKVARTIRENSES